MLLDVSKLIRENKNKSGFKGALANMLSELYEVYKKSLLTTPFDIYIDWALKSTIISYVGLVSFFTILFWLKVHYPILITLIFSMVLAVPCSLCVLLAFVYYPYHVTKARGEAIRSKLIYTVSYMAAISAAGVIPIRIFERVAQIDPTKEIRREALRFLRDIKLLGHDVLTALKTRAENAPIKILQEFYSGLRNVILTSGDIREYLVFFLKRLIRERSEELAKVTSALATISEIYVTLMVAGPIVALITLSVMQMIWPQSRLMGIPLSLIIIIMIFVLLPISAIIMLIIVDSISSRV